MTDARFVHEIVQPLIRDACGLVLILLLLVPFCHSEPQGESLILRDKSLRCLQPSQCSYGLADDFARDDKKNRSMRKSKNTIRSKK
jgi:hypothetical protein